MIGTLDEEAERDGWRMVISTGDKDMAQLVRPARHAREHDVERDARRSGRQEEVRREAGNVSRLPHADRRSDRQHSGRRQGGAEDRVASGSCSTARSRACSHTRDEIGGVAGENLRKMRDWLPKARELLTIKCDVPLAGDDRRISSRKRDRQSNAQLFERFEFKTWLQGRWKALAALRPERRPPAAPAAATEKREYGTVLTEEELKDAAAADRGAELVGFDTERGRGPDDAAAGRPLVRRRRRGGVLPFAHGYPGAPAQLPIEVALERCSSHGSNGPTARRSART